MSCIILKMQWCGKDNGGIGQASQDFRAKYFRSSLRPKEKDDDKFELSAAGADAVSAE